jgi:hypothetical protein
MLFDAGSGLAATKQQRLIREEITMKRWSAAETGLVTLFDGKNLNNWVAIGDANWRLEDGVVIAD